MKYYDSEGDGDVTTHLQESLSVKLFVISGLRALRSRCVRDNLMVSLVPPGHCGEF